MSSAVAIAFGLSPRVFRSIHAMVGSRTCEATMTEERFQQIERLVELPSTSSARHVPTMDQSETPEIRRRHSLRTPMSSSKATPLPPEAFNDVLAKMMQAAKAEWCETMADLEAKQKAAQETLDAVIASNGRVWEHVRDGATHAREELERAIQKNPSEL